MVLGSREGEKSEKLASYRCFNIDSQNNGRDSANIAPKMGQHGANIGLRPGQHGPRQALHGPTWP